MNKNELPDIVVNQMEDAGVDIGRAESRTHLNIMYASRRELDDEQKEAFFREIVGETMGQSSLAVLESMSSNTFEFLVYSAMMANLCLHEKESVLTNRIRIDKGIKEYKGSDIFFLMALGKLMAEGFENAEDKYNTGPSAHRRGGME